MSSSNDFLQLSKLDLKAGQILLVQANVHSLAYNVHRRLVGMFREYLDSLGLDNEVMVIDKSIDVSVVEAEDAEKIKEQEEMLWSMQALQAGLGKPLEHKGFVQTENG